ncbi:HAD superfamily hydrolase (TIGR01509 family) [Dysgonomonas hofstadii]|uniref:HAD superfamily hydrolase (TIGR01509 family) n=1 Tax=Dysgonomonas hofstadii TaxID=637886 RepID=A0A840CYY6_9BACT|nr:HAD family phosphatase [Dysgonomonas hofstadii]MBB4037945.1 HAD superfamily hydrolase (TIGR01509 family) [Dysgonomonas hofstadii]
MAKSKITTVLFGLDGVVVDTEKEYDKFWSSIADNNRLKINNFAAVIKGMTLNSIIELYFAISTFEEKQAIRKACSDMEQSIDYTKLVIPGVLGFIEYLKDAGYKTGLVTSSPTAKVKVVLDQLSLTDTFDTVITSDSIKKGKPDPMGYVLAKTNLGVQSGECAVFEDSFTGIKAATYAFMRVIGVATTLSESFLKDYTYGIVKDFSDLEKLKSYLG